MTQKKTDAAAGMEIETKGIVCPKCNAWNAKKHLWFSKGQKEAMRLSGKEIETVIFDKELMYYTEATLLKSPQGLWDDYVYIGHCYPINQCRECNAALLATCR